jgi:hypothetical protein
MKIPIATRKTAATLAYLLDGHNTIHIDKTIQQIVYYLWWSATGNRTFIFLYVVAINQVKKDEMGGACSMNAGEEECI